MPPYSPPICTMKFPCELLAEPYLAQVRIQVARTLREREFTQVEIADLLQVSQPVVSGYLKKSKNQSKLPPDLISRAITVAEDITRILQVQGKNGTEQAIQLGCHNCKIMRQYGPVCEYHRLSTDNLDLKCTACHTQPDLIQLQVSKSDLLIDLSKFFNTISSKTGFHHYIPEIGLQIVYSIENPQGPSDIAAFPGRIIKRKGRTLLSEIPVFDGSETISQFLLAIKKANSGVRCLMTIKSSPVTLAKLEKSNYKYHIIQGLEEGFYTKIDNIDLNTNTPFFLIGEHSIGFESITYVCTKSLDEMLDIIEYLI